MTTKTPKYLATIAAQTDLFYEYRAARLALDKQVAQAKAREDAAYADLKKMMLDHDVQSAEGALGPVRVELEVQAKLTSWPELCAYIHKYRAYELLQKRLTISAVRERFDNGTTIPGVEIAEEPVLRFARG